MYKDKPPTQTLYYGYNTFAKSNNLKIKLSCIPFYTPQVWNLGSIGSQLSCDSAYHQAITFLFKLRDYNSRTIKSSTHNT